MDKVEMNKVFAEFMELPKEEELYKGNEIYIVDKVFNEGSFGHTIAQIKYHRSYDWLMPVWFKFCGLEFSSLCINHEQWNEFRVFKERVSYKILNRSDVSEAHKLLFEAIQWYNSINNINKEK